MIYTSGNWRKLTLSYWYKINDHIHMFSILFNTSPTLILTHILILILELHTFIAVVFQTLLLELARELLTPAELAIQSRFLYIFSIVTHTEYLYESWALISLFNTYTPNFFMELSSDLCNSVRIYTAWNTLLWSRIVQFYAITITENTCCN